MPGISPKGKVKVRAVIALAMMATWAVVVASGFLLYLAPDGPRSGQIALLGGWRKAEWGELHTWFSFTASAVTLLHLAVDWRAFQGALKCLVRGDVARQPAGGG